MKRLRRYFRIAWIAQLAFVVLALPAAHVHRHAPGECCGSVCSGDSHNGGTHDHGSCDSPDHASHDHGATCSHDSSCSHSHAVAEREEIVLALGERALQDPDASSHDHCAACELTRLIGHGFAPAAESVFVVSCVESTPCFVATCFGRELESRGCRGPPVAC